MSNLDYSPVDKKECIIHPNKPNNGGYVRLTITSAGKVHSMLAHRLAYQEAYGAIPEGMFVLHKCDNPPCVNPEHLFVGTHADNMKDRGNKGRSRGR